MEDGGTSLFWEFSGSGIGRVVRPVLNWGLPLRNGVASAGFVPVGREFLHYHTHSKASANRASTGTSPDGELPGISVLTGLNPHS